MTNNAPTPAKHSAAANAAINAGAAASAAGASHPAHISPTSPATSASDPTKATARRRNDHKRRNILLGGAGVLGTAALGSSAWALNRFVIDHTEITDVAAYEAANQRTAATTSAASTASTTEATITADGYTSGTTQLSISRRTQGSGDDTITYYVADLRLTDATALRSAFANNQFGANIVAKPSTMAAEHDAVWAVNGDYYGFRSDGILIRNGVVYRDSGVRDGIAFYTDGRVELYDETSTTAQALLDAGVWNTLSFGPALLNSGQVLAGIESVEVDTNFGNHSIQGTHPRTAVGVVEDGHLIFIVVDGRNKGYSRGASLTELATIMQNLGCTKAYNLDGGGSSAMYWDGQIINQPSNGGERNTSDILYIAQGA